MLSEEDLKIRDQHDPNYESEEDEDVSINQNCYSYYYDVRCVSKLSDYFLWGLFTSVQGCAPMVPGCLGRPDNLISFI